jgi:hypothetical protein
LQSLYTTSHDLNNNYPGVQVIDDVRRGSSVAALPTARADDEFSSDKEGFGVFDAVSSHNMEVAENNVSIGNNKVLVDNDVSSDRVVDIKKMFPLNTRRRLFPMMRFPATTRMFLPRVTTVCVAISQLGLPRSNSFAVPVKAHLKGQDIPRQSILTANQL